MVPPSLWQMGTVSPQKAQKASSSITQQDASDLDKARQLLPLFMVVQHQQQI